ncbi:hypothetical protein AYI70_g7263, partial [Smittium culicis]
MDQSPSSDEMFIINKIVEAEINNPAVVEIVLNIWRDKSAFEGPVIAKLKSATINPSNALANLPLIALKVSSSSNDLNFSSELPRKNIEESKNSDSTNNEINPKAMIAVDVINADSVSLIPEKNNQNSTAPQQSQTHTQKELDTHQRPPFIQYHHPNHLPHSLPHPPPPPHPIPPPPPPPPLPPPPP